MLNIGCHLSTSRGYRHMGEEALSIEANTIQLFTRNPRGSKSKDIEEKDLKGLLKILKNNDFAPLLGHAPYTLNASSKDERVREFALKILEDDLQRMEAIPNNFYNFHPGSHLGQGVEKGISLISQALNAVLKPEQTTTVLIETMAGKGTEIGSNFGEIKKIIEGVNLSDKVGVCLDTCHVFDAGYDLVNNLEGVLDEFDREIGLNKLKAIHLNDSKNPLGSRKDTHEKIGEGYLGLEAIISIINNPRLSHLPFFLETPNEIEGYAYEIEVLREAYEQ